MNRRVYADLQKTDGRGRVLLSTVGTKQDLASLGIALEEGMHLAFYSDDVNERGERDDLLYEGVVRFDGERRVWVAAIDRDDVKHASDMDRNEPDEHIP
jgi:hypothetical protein